MSVAVRLYADGVPEPVTATVGVVTGVDREVAARGVEHLAAVTAEGGTGELLEAGGRDQVVGRGRADEAALTEERLDVGAVGLLLADHVVEVALERDLGRRRSP